MWLPARKKKKPAQQEEAKLNTFTVETREAMSNTLKNCMLKKKVRLLTFSASTFVHLVTLCLRFHNHVRALSTTEGCGYL